MTIDTMLASGQSYYYSETETLIRVYRDHYTLSHPDSANAKTFPATGISKWLTNHSVHLLKGKLTLVKSGSGPVYQLNDGTITRIDHALDHGFQEHSIEFVHRDTLYRHGGYGLWEARDFISWFSFTTLEWEILRPIAGPDFPPGLFMHHAALDGDDLYLYGGYTVDPWNRLKRITNKEVWKFSFRLRRWFNMGTLDDELADSNWSFWQLQFSGSPERFYLWDQWLISVNAGENRLAYFPMDPALVQGPACCTG
ncbi:MAG: hypothetical protein ACKOYP_10760, partial [Bacteroidota bacterium]